MSSRTEYQRNWRKTHPDNVRKNKKTSYWNNPEKHRKRARDHWRKLNPITFKNELKLCHLQGKQKQLPLPLFRKLMHIAQYAVEVYTNKIVDRYDDISPIYDKVVEELASFQQECNKLASEKGSLTEQDKIDIALRCEYVTYPYPFKEYL